MFLRVENNSYFDQKLAEIQFVSHFYLIAIKIFEDLYTLLNLSPRETRIAHLNEFDNITSDTLNQLMTSHEDEIKKYPIIIPQPGNFHRRHIKADDKEAKETAMRSFRQQVFKIIVGIREDFSKQLDNEEISLAQLKQSFSDLLNEAKLKQLKAMEDIEKLVLEISNHTFDIRVTDSRRHAEHSIKPN